MLLNVLLLPTPSKVWIFVYFGIFKRPDKGKSLEVLPMVVLTSELAKLAYPTEKELTELVELGLVYVPNKNENRD